MPRPAIALRQGDITLWRDEEVVDETRAHRQFNADRYEASECRFKLSNGQDSWLHHDQGLKPSFVVESYS